NDGPVAVVCRQIARDAGSSEDLGCLLVCEDNNHPEAFMRKSRQEWLRNKAKKSGRRLKVVQGGRASRPYGIELSAKTIRYETADRIEAIPCGGIGAIHQLAHRVGLVRALDERLPILMIRRP